MRLARLRPRRLSTVWTSSRSRATRCASTIGSAGEPCWPTSTPSSRSIAAAAISTVRSRATASGWRVRAARRWCASWRSA